MQANYVDKNVELKLYNIFWKNSKKLLSIACKVIWYVQNRPPLTTVKFLNEKHVIKRNLLQAKTIEYENFTWVEPLMCCLMSWAQNRIDRNNIPELVPNSLQ